VMSLPLSHPRGRRDVDGHHPPADPAAGQRDADTVADAHLVPDTVGDQVVECLVDGGLVGQDPDDPLLGNEAQRPGAQRPRADLSSSTRVVCSQENSFSSRPKWP
jgi:hypothetical protein